MTQETGIDARVPEGQCLSVDLYCSVHERTHDVVGGILERGQVATMVPSLEVGDRDERLDRAVARSRSETGQRGIDTGHPRLDRDDAVGDRQAEVLMRVDADLGRRVEHIAVGRDPFSDRLHRQVSTRVGDIDALRAVRLHELRLLGEQWGRRHVAHHQEARHVHAELACELDVLRRDICLGAVRCDANRADTEVVRPFELVDRADAGQQQRREPGVGRGIGGGLDPLPVGMAARAVVE